MPRETKVNNDCQPTVLWLDQVEQRISVNVILFYLEPRLEFMVFGFPLIAAVLEKYHQLPYRTLQFMLRRTHLADSLPSLVPQSN